MIHRVQLEFSLGIFFLIDVKQNNILHELENKTTQKI